MEVCTVGGFSEVGKNMTAVKIKDDVIIFDAGIYLPALVESQERENPREDGDRSEDTLRESKTEAPFSGKLLYNTEKRTYSCAACGNVLFDSRSKFDPGCGWPSFYDAKRGSVRLKKDFSHFMVRTEVLCSKCGSHLGHLFNDAPQTPTGKRYCINSAALRFEKDGKKKNPKKED